MEDQWSLTGGHGPTGEAVRLQQRHQPVWEQEDGVHDVLSFWFRMLQDQVLLQSVQWTNGIGMNTNFTLDQDQQGAGLPPLTLVAFRIKQLHNRRLILLRMQSFMKTTEDDGGDTTEEMSCEESNRCELEAIQTELEELLAVKEELEKKGKLSKLKVKGQQDVLPTYKSETPRGGIYTLPPPQLDDVTLERRVKTRPVDEGPAGPVVPVDSLGQTPAITKCPSCEEVVFTETHSSVGQASWMLCFLCTMTGCVTGCCLIPFCMKGLKKVRHQCPQCQAHIHTYQPL